MNKPAPVDGSSDQIIYALDVQKGVVRFTLKPDKFALRPVTVEIPILIVAAAQCSIALLSLMSQGVNVAIPQVVDPTKERTA